MNLKLSISTICSVTGANFIENKSLSTPSEISNIIIDTRNPSIHAGTLFVTLQGEKENGKKYTTNFIDKGGLVVLTDDPIEGIRAHQLICPNPLKALQALAKYHRSKFQYPVIGITGSHGKTIVKEWLYHLLKKDFSIVRSPKSYNSQVGVPLSVLEMTEAHNLGIFEAGISHPNEMAALEEIIQPTIGVFTGIGDAHSAHFSSEKEKQDEKFILYKNVTKLISSEGVEEETGIPFSDAASRKNAGLIKLVAEYLGLDQTKIKERLKTLPAVSMRMEQIEGQHNCILLNDAYSADLSAMEIGLRQLNNLATNKQKVIILTPFEESTDSARDKLIELIKRESPDRLIWIGEETNLPNELVSESYRSADEFLNASPLIENAVILLKGARKASLERIVSRLAERKHITRLTINFKAMRHNLNYFRSKINGAKVLAMVKAQAYGGGMVELASFLQTEKVDFFGVAYADEGVRLRQAGIDLPILVMNPEEDAFDDIVDYHLEPSIYSPEILDEFIHHLILREKYRYPIHIKLDTGMNRLGFVEEDLAELCTTIQTQPEIVIASVFSHLSVADDAKENEFTYGQIRNFEVMSGMIKDRIGYDFDRHLANSAGAINYSRAHFDMIRLGIGIFGLLNFGDLENAVTFTSHISQIKWIKEGDSVGYGRSYIAGAPTRIGIVPVGYADGLRRGLSQGQWSLLVNGKAAKIVGNICMDMCMIDITDIDAKKGDEVEIFGDHNSLFNMADALNTIPYEIISSISSRVHRIYIDE